MPSLPRKRLIVIGQEEAATGEGARGPWTIYKIEATTMNGEPIEEALNSFEPLPEGQPIDVTVKEREDERYGKQYTLKLVREGSKTDDVLLRLNELEKRVNLLEEAVGPEMLSEMGRT